ncbi:MAG: methyl-accepting chemotaxis protein [Spirochaetales bacterium]|nr:methyl-accepting chemotaxis protein [Spirochaetales bacterium]
MNENSGLTFFGKMKISTKIILSSIFFLVPMGIMLIISLNSIQYDIRFSTLEVHGNEYQAPLESLLQYTQDYWYYDREEANNKAVLSSIHDVVMESFDKLQGVQDSIGEDLQFTDEGLKLRSREHLVPSLMKSRWEDIRKNDSEEEYLALVADIREMITHSGDTSNLILDPDLDSYYLMDLSLLVLPQTQDRLGEILLYGARVLDNREKEDSPGVLSQEEKLNFYVYAKLLEESDYERIKGSTKTAINEDPNFYGIYEPLQKDIPSSYKSYEIPTLKLIDMLYELGTEDYVSISRQEFISAAMEARSQSFSYWYDVVDTMDGLLEIRIGSYRQQFMKYLVSAIITLVCAWVIFIVIRKNILTSISSLLAAFDKATGNDLSTRIDITSSDEIGECSNGFNDLLKKFSDLMTKLQSMTSVLTESVQNLNVTSQEVFATSNDQAAAVKEIVTTMEDSDSLSKSIATSISDISQLATGTTEAVRNGFEIIKTTLDKMNEIKESNGETIAGIKFLSEKIESIWEIVNLINGIADQTKIIAFNAELEASSAGEAGKSFQLVATEIRRLADGTVSSTSEIKNRINEIQHSSDTLIVSSEEGTKKISEGNELTGQMNRVFEGILSSTEKTAQSTDQISVSINQQVSSFEQILITLKQISEGIDNFVVATKASATSAETLKDMAEDLDNRIEMFHVQKDDDEPMLLED